MLLLDPNNSYASDSQESLLPDERGSFADNQITQGSPFQEKTGLQVSEIMKQKAKEQALKRLNKPMDKKLAALGTKAGFSPEALSGLSQDTPENRERLKEEARERAQKFSKKAGEKLEKRLAGRGTQLGERAVGAGKAARVGQEAKMAATAAKGAKTAATAAKGAKTAGTAVKGIQGVVAAAGALSGPETLGLGTIAAILLNIAISLGISDAIDCLFEIKAGNMKKAMFHAIKAIYLIVMFVLLLITALLSVSVIGIIFGVPMLLLLNIYAIMGVFFPDIPTLQGLSRKWMWMILILLDIYAIVMVILIVAGVLYGVCTETTIGSMLGYSGVIGGAIDYIDTNLGTGGAVSGLNQACAAISTFN